MALRMMQVGLGGFGKRWMRVVLDHPDWEYVGIATRNEKVRHECGDACGLPAVARLSSLPALVGSGIAADAVLITTPHFRHRDDVVAAFNHGLNVLVEKPLAGKLDDCLAISRAAGRAGSTCMVGENYRFGDGAIKMREIVGSGTIGTVEFISLQYFAGHTFPDGDWRNEYEYPVLIENSTHQFDLIRYVTGKEPLTVFCDAFGSSRVPHWPKVNVSAHFEMEDGLRAHYSASWAYSEFRTPWEGLWRVHGSDGSIFWRENEIVVETEGRTKTYNSKSQSSDYTLAATLEEFTAAIRGGRSPSVDIEDNMQTIGMVFGAIRSSQTGARVALKEILGG